MPDTIQTGAKVVRCLPERRSLAVSLQNNRQPFCSLGITFRFPDRDRDVVLIVKDMVPKAKNLGRARGALTPMFRQLTFLPEGRNEILRDGEKQSTTSASG
jgi:hypothetical protein